MALSQCDNEPRQHTLHFEHLWQKGIRLALPKISQVMTQKDLALNLTCRPHGHVKESSEISVCAFRTALGYVARDRNGGSSQLGG